MLSTNARCLVIILGGQYNLWWIFTARRYVKRGICRRRVSAGFVLTIASRSPSAIAELLVTQYRSVTDTHTHRQTDGQIHDTACTALSIASRGKKRHIARLTKYNYQATSVG